MVFYTSDLHLGHANVIRHCDRPFSSADEMDRERRDDPFCSASAVFVFRLGITHLALQKHNIKIPGVEAQCH